MKTDDKIIKCAELTEAFQKRLFALQENTSDGDLKDHVLAYTQQLKMVIATRTKYLKVK